MKHSNTHVRRIIKLEVPKHCIQYDQSMPLQRSFVKMQNFSLGVDASVQSGRHRRYVGCFSHLCHEANVGIQEKAIDWKEVSPSRENRPMML